MSKKYSNEEIPDLKGKVAIVTGGNGGIGYEITKQLSIHGARVYMASRNKQKAEDAMKKLQEEHDANQKEGADGVQKLELEFLELDLMHLNACKKAADDFLAKEKDLHILVCNAGVMAPGYQLTDDGIEQSFQTNHLSHFALFANLAKTMIKSAHESGHPSRLVNLSSVAHTFERFNPSLKLDFTSKEAINRKMGFDQIGKYMRYSQSKLAALLFSREVNKRFKPNEIRSTAVHPGLVASNLYSKTPLAPIAPLVFISSADGALAPLYAATSTEIEEKNGFDDYYATYGIKSKDSAASHDEKLMTDLWNISEELTGTKIDTEEVSKHGNAQL
ncbi:NAD(P)-binding protein [Meira miltonrushii]|uniref:NAD(P)-binding protein n=1 Tax=Meira miltonrushii TaxID=1280837 RepID=A0A316V2J6_9BASI|nr:NAD(P)-binding protein [Meira miltonrushii]PWN31682.1 NAD(P)-binding protein [Meira miltonrushii]